MICCIHIPSDADLSCDKVNASLQQAAACFEAAFPHTAAWPFTCESWLLSPVLEQLLPADSRILSFQKLFCLSPFDPGRGNSFNELLLKDQEQKEYGQDGNHCTGHQFRIIRVILSLHKSQSGGQRHLLR